MTPVGWAAGRRILLAARGAAPLQRAAGWRAERPAAHRHSELSQSLFASSDAHQAAAGSGRPAQQLLLGLGALQLPWLAVSRCKEEISHLRTPKVFGSQQKRSRCSQRRCETGTHGLCVVAPGRVQQRAAALSIRFSKVDMCTKLVSRKGLLETIWLGRIER